MNDINQPNAVVLLSGGLDSTTTLAITKYQGFNVFALTALQLDEDLVEAFHKFDFALVVETNGTKALPKGIDWICVSPKADAELVVQ